MAQILDILPAGPILLTFLVASVALAVTPGPGVFYIVSRSLVDGRAAGIASVAGVALGNLGSATGVSLGLGAIFAASSAAFTLVKYAGAAYLIYLGIEALRNVGRSSSASVASREVSRGRVLWDGFAVALLNPKTALFFAAFLPQFMHSDADPISQSLALSLLFVAIAVATDTIYALVAASVGRYLVQKATWRKRTRYLESGTFIGLGLFAALSDARRDK